LPSYVKWCNGAWVDAGIFVWLEVFELVEDVDKAVKVLINLSNMCELQASTRLLVQSTLAQTYFNVSRP
jgi:hypothetical protein